MHDLIIRSATLVDGFGTPARKADLAVRQGRISAIGVVEDEAAEVVDAMGLVLAPGVIDVHTHYDAQLTWDSQASPSPALGVTTVVIGNCGFGIAPATQEARDTIMKNLATVEAMSIDSLRAGIDWDFETFADYLALLRRKGTCPNVAAYASHSAIRTVVMGEAASERAATTDELQCMVRVFRDCMAAGAFGLGSSTFENHKGWGGVPVPSRLANEDEFRAFASVVAEFQHGTMMMTAGNGTSISFLEELAKISGRPVIYAPLLHYSNQPNRARDLSAACRSARERGHPVYAQVSCQPLSMDFTLNAPYPMLTIAGWPQTPDIENLIQVYQGRDFRQQVREDLKKPNGARIFNGDWDRVEVSLGATPETKRHEGRTIAEIAAEANADELDVFLDIGLEDGLATVFTGKLLNIEEDKVSELLADEGSLVSLSDAGAHHTFFCDAGYAMHLLGHWVRERGLFSLSEAVQMLTADIADIYGIPNRGRLRVGAWADMILFDPVTISITKPKRVFDLPAGGMRLVRDAPGLAGTWVNGIKVFDGEDYTNVHCPGHILTEFESGLSSIGMPGHRRVVA